MNPIRSFDEFVKSGVVRKRDPDRPRADFLLAESEKDYSFLLKVVGKFSVSDDGANTIVKQCYDVLMGFIRANMLLKGYSASGAGAHEAEVSYLGVLGFKEKDVQFVNQLRYFRNGMLYYGTKLDKEYAEKVLSFLKEFYPKLKNLLEGKC